MVQDVGDQGLEGDGVSQYWEDIQEVYALMISLIMGVSYSQSERKDNLLGEVPVESQEAFEVFSIGHGGQRRRPLVRLHFALVSWGVCLRQGEREEEKEPSSTG